MVADCFFSLPPAQSKSFPGKDGTRIAECDAARSGLVWAEAMGPGMPQQVLAGRAGLSPWKKGGAAHKPPKKNCDLSIPRS